MRLLSTTRSQITISSFCVIFLLSIYPVEANGQDEKYAEPIKEIGETGNIESCNCVAFRLDDIQGFWLNNPQIAIIEKFQNKNIPLTIGIIGAEKFKFGEDPKITNFVKKAINADGSIIEIANHGWEHESFPTFNKNTQSELIRKTTERIFNLLGVTPTVFIPPLNEFDQNTLRALEENNYTHLSSMSDLDPPPYPFQGLSVYNFPETATTGTYSTDLGIFQKIGNEETLENAKKSIDSNGFAVITMHPQEFSMIEKGTYTNQVDWDQIDELELLVEKIQKSDLKIVFLSQINENAIGLSGHEKMELPKDKSSNFHKFKEARQAEFRGISCMPGEVEAIRVTNPRSICVDQDTAKRWSQLGIAEIIGEVVAPGTEVTKQKDERKKSTQEEMQLDIESVEPKSGTITADDVSGITKLRFGECSFNTSPMPPDSQYTATCGNIPGFNELDSVVITRNVGSSCLVDLTGSIDDYGNLKIVLWNRCSFASSFANGQYSFIAFSTN